MSAQRASAGRTNGHHAYTDPPDDSGYYEDL
jgi:hypothetical protein